MPPRKQIKPRIIVQKSKQTKIIPYLSRLLRTSFNEEDSEEAECQNVSKLHCSCNTNRINEYNQYRNEIVKNVSLEAKGNKDVSSQPMKTPKYFSVVGLFLWQITATITENLAVEAQFSKMPVSPPLLSQITRRKEERNRLPYIFLVILYFSLPNRSGCSVSLPAYFPKHESVSLSFC